MSLTKTYKTNPELENAGVSVKLSPNEDGTIPEFILARAGKSNKEYQKQLTAAFKPHARAHKLGTLENEIAERIMLEVFIRSVVKGWSNILMSDVTGNDGKNGTQLDTGFAPFNFENAKALFTRLPELYDDLSDKADSASLFRDEDRETDVKN